MSVRLRNVLLMIVLPGCGSLELKTEVMYMILIAILVVLKLLNLYLLMITGGINFWFTPLLLKIDPYT